MTASIPYATTQFASLEQALKHYFGYDSLRPGQRQIIEYTLHDRDLLVIRPTSGGKSFCFQLPALLKEGVMIVVSPLTALMQDPGAGAAKQRHSRHIADNTHAAKGSDALRLRLTHPTFNST